MAKKKATTAKKADVEAKQAVPVEDVAKTDAVVVNTSKRDDYGETQDTKSRHQEHIGRCRAKIDKAIALGKLNNIGFWSINIDDKFDEATAALFVEELENDGIKVEFLDKRNADPPRRIMVLSW